VRDQRAVCAPAGATVSPLVAFRLPYEVKSGAFRQRMRGRYQIALKSFQRTG
jgi:hypothetical protein